MAWVFGPEEGNKVLFKIVLFGPSEKTLEGMLVRVALKVGLDVKPPPTPSPVPSTSSLELSLGTVKGRRTEVLLLTVPGESPYPAQRLLVLKGADGVIFVAGKTPADERRAFDELRGHLEALGYEWATFPMVLAGAGGAGLPEALGEPGRPGVEANLASGQGVMDAVKAVAHQALTAFHARGGG